MSLARLVEDLEEKAEAMKVELCDVMNLKSVMLENVGQPPRDGLQLLLRVWNAAVKLRQRTVKLDRYDASEFRVHVIPQMRMLVADMLQAWNRGDARLVFSCTVYTYHAFMEAENKVLCEKIFVEAVRMYRCFELPSSEIKGLLARLLAWRASEVDGECGEGVDLTWFREAVAKYTLDASVIITCVYQKAIALRSLNWCEYGMDLLAELDVGTEAWEQNLTILKVTLLLDAEKLDVVDSLLGTLEPCLMTECLGLKYRMLSNKSCDDVLQEDLLNFVQKTEHAHQVLLSLLDFIATHAARLEMKKITAFVTSVLALKDLTMEQKQQVCLNSAQIACYASNIELAKAMILWARESSCRNYVFSMFWNKAIEQKVNRNCENGIIWMECARELSNDQTSKSDCSRFICECLVDVGKTNDAITVINSVLEVDPHSLPCCVMKFRILKNANKIPDAVAMVRDCMGAITMDDGGCQFAIAMSSELYEAGELSGALDCLISVLDSLSLVDEASGLCNQILKSCGAIIQDIEDSNCRSQYLKLIAQKITPRKAINASICTAMSDIAYTTGKVFIERSQWDDAYNCFTTSSQLAGGCLSLRYRGDVHAAQCLVKLQHFEEARILLSKTQEFDASVSQVDRDLWCAVQVQVALGTSSEYHSISQMISKISTGKVLVELCKNIVRINMMNAPLLQEILHQAGKIDGEQHNLMASLLQVLFDCATGVSELRKFYEIVFMNDRQPPLPSEQRQFFVAKAWNTGTECARRGNMKDSQWWLLKALTILKSDENLHRLYQRKLYQQYKEFLVYRDRVSLTS